ncbi:MAG: hypothetical protein AAGB51_14095 [Planctomycetota bacterium]
MVKWTSLALLVLILSSSAGCTGYTLKTDREAKFAWRFGIDSSRPRNTFKTKDKYTVGPDRPARFSTDWPPPIIPRGIDVVVWTDTHVAYRDINPYKNELDGSTIVIADHEWRPLTSADRDIIAGTLRVGMSRDDVIRLYGEPRDTRSSTSALSGRSETWTYGQFPYTHFWIYFSGDRVTGWAD